MDEPMKIINSISITREYKKIIMMNKPLTFGIIGAGIALAVVVGVLFVMPLVTAPAPKALQPQQQDPERQAGV